MPKKTICRFCNKKFGRRIIFDHYGECLKNVHNDKSGYLVRFFSHGVTGNVYFIYAIVGLNCKFSHMDKFLRNTWCECCKHTSSFQRYNEEWNTLIIIPKTSLFSNYNEHDKFQYEYDMGNTTTIYFEILKKIDGTDKTNKILIAIQNEHPEMKCSECAENATCLASFAKCRGIPLCEACSEKIKEVCSNIVNSPRTGVCIY